MNISQSILEMRHRRTLIFIAFGLGLLIYVIHLIQEIYALNADKNELLSINDILTVRLEKVIHLKTVRQKTNNLPIVYAITPTYKRHEQKAKLTRMSQTLALVPHVHWIVVEDAVGNSQLVTKLLQESNLIRYTHLNVKTPRDQQPAPRCTKHRGVAQRNLGLQWIRKYKAHEKTGVVYFMDDDNTYNIKIFTEMSKIKKVGIWPVGLVGGLSAEQPVVDPKTGRVVHYNTGFGLDRAFATDMAGFAINITLILSKPEAVFSCTSVGGYLENDFLSLLTSKEELEPLADNCTKVYVWHTRAKETKLTDDYSWFKSLKNTFIYI